MSCSRKRRNKTQLATASRVIRRKCCDDGGGGGAPCYCFCYMCVACCPDGTYDIVFLPKFSPLCQGRIRPIVQWAINDKCYVVHNHPDDVIFWNIHDPSCCETDYGDNENCLGFDIPEGCDPLPDGVMPLPDDAVFLTGLTCVVNCDDNLCECDEDPDPDPTCCGSFKPCTRPLLGSTVSWHVKFFGTYSESWLCGTDHNNKYMDSETHTFNHAFTITDNSSGCTANASHSEPHNITLQTCDGPANLGLNLSGAATSRLNSGNITRSPAGLTIGSTSINNPAHGIEVGNAFGVVNMSKSLISSAWGAHAYTEGFRINFLRDVCNGFPYEAQFSGSISPFGNGVRCGKLLGGAFNVTSSVVPFDNDFCELPVQTANFRATLLVIENEIVGC